MKILTFFILSYIIMTRKLVLVKRYAALSPRHKWQNTLLMPIVFTEISEKLFMQNIFFDSLCISANRKAAQSSPHRLRRYIALIFLR